MLGIDPGQPIYDVQTLEELTDLALGPSRLALVLLSVFGAIALLPASVGLYAVISYSVTRRTQEIGIRMAIGAQSPEVLTLILKEGMRWASVGLVFGLAVSLVLSRFMSSLLYGVRPSDSQTLLAASAVLMLGCIIGNLHSRPSRDEGGSHCGSADGVNDRGHGQCDFALSYRP